MTPVVECPDCRGTGSLMAMVDFVDRTKSGPMRIQCSRCKGAGSVDRIMEEWMRVGGTHRTWRVAQHESLRECAARLGIPVPDLSAMESGRTDPARLVSDTPPGLLAP